MNDGLVAQNRKARHKYNIGETFEAGLVLKGTEVKSLRNHTANLQDGFAMFEAGELYLHNVHIGPFAQGNRNNHEPMRTRKLLLNKAELEKIRTRLIDRGHTLVPLKIYFNNKGLAKLLLAIAKGKQKYDKRDVIERERSRKELRSVKAKKLR